MIHTQTHDDAHAATHSKRFVIDDELARLPACERIAAIRLDRIRRVAGLPERPVTLDLGCGSGLYVAAFARAGCDVVGVEPHAATREAAAQLGERLGIELRISDGHAERIPFEDASFDFVYCNQVIEHVADPAASFAEVARVLRPGGAFWFSAISSLCPSQTEIRRFPLFPWYPDRLKRRIMYWARDHHPHLVNYTKTPAINWFTPSKARRMLLANGFSEVWDRWSLRGDSEGGSTYRAALRLIRTLPPARLLADMLVRNCSYGARK
jgi:2-polyprenyl-6-hydroxyphenyl methylase/3-demethylubiquinone-9 3-methyltransferase